MLHLFHIYLICILIVIYISADYLNQGRQFVLKSGGDKRSDEKTLQQDGKNIE